MASQRTCATGDLLLDGGEGAREKLEVEHATGLLLLELLDADGERGCRTGGAAGGAFHGLFALS